MYVCECECVSVCVKNDDPYSTDGLFEIECVMNVYLKIIRIYLQNAE